MARFVTRSQVYIYIHTHVRATRSQIRAALCVNGGKLGEDKDGPAVTPDYSQTFVHIEQVHIGQTVSTQRTGELVFKRAIFLYFGGDRRAHEHLDSQKLSLLTHTVLGWVHGELTLPLSLVNGVVVGFNLATVE